MTKYEGGCACGAVRYVCTAEPTYAIQCHCRACQRAGGGGHSSLLAVPLEALSPAGPLATHKSKADSGHQVTRSFCPRCGSPVSNRTERMPETVYLHAGCLDDPGRFTPQQAVWIEAAQPWDPIDPKLRTS